MSARHAQPRAADALLARWPFPVDILATDGQPVVAYTDVGDGPPLLLVHVGFSSFLWRDLIVDLCPDFRCVTLDAPGTGRSGGTPVVGLGDAARAVDALVTHLGLDRFVLVIHDLGGPAALHAAAAWPQRIAGLAAINTFGWRPRGAAFRTMLALMGSAPVRGLDAWTGWLPRLSSTRAGVGRHYDRADRRAFRDRVPRDARRAFHHYLRSARHHDYTAVDTAVDQLQDRPLLTVFGARNDPLHFQPEWARRFPDTTATAVPRGNHFPMCDAPDLVAKAIRSWHLLQYPTSRGHNGAPPSSKPT